MTCWASFWPKYARSAPTRLNRIATTVATPVEVPGPGGALERLGDRPDRDRRVEARRIDLLDRRRADEVDALGLADREVARLVARVLREVGASLNWRGLTKIVTTTVASLGAGPPDQRAVAVVQPAHRRARGRPAAARVERGAQLRAGADDAVRRGLGTSLEVAVERDARPSGTRRAAARSRRPAPEDLVEHRVVHADGLRVARERAGLDVGGVGRGRLEDRLAQVGVRLGVARDAVAEPSRSVMTWTWPLQPAPAPMPMVGMRRRSVIAAASCSGTSSRTIENAPASWTASASASSGAPARGPCPGPGPCRPCRAAACGVQPMWPMTGMPALTSASMIRALRTPPSTLTAWAPASRRKRPAFSTRLVGVA